MWVAGLRPGAGAPPCATRFRICEARRGEGRRLRRWDPVEGLAVDPVLGGLFDDRPEPVPADSVPDRRIGDDHRRPFGQSGGVHRRPGTHRREAPAGHSLPRRRRFGSMLRRSLSKAAAKSMLPAFSRQRRRVHLDPAGDALPRRSPVRRLSGGGAPDSALCSRAAHVTRCDSPSRSPPLPGRECYVGLPGLPGAGAPPCATASTIPPAAPPPVGALRSTPPVCADDSLSSSVAHVTR